MFLLCGRICLRAGAVFPRPSLPAGRGLFPRPSLPAGKGLFPRPSLPSGRDFGPVRTSGAFPPTAARQAPPVHEATGGYAVRSPCPSGIPRPRHNAVLPWTARIVLVLTSWLHRFASLSLKSGIAARITPVLTLWLHRFASLGLKSRIDAAVGPVSEQSLQRVPSLPPEIQNHCRPRVISEQNMQRFPSLPHEIQNHCSRGASFRAIHAAIPKFTP